MSEEREPLDRAELEALIDQGEVKPVPLDLSQCNYWFQTPGGRLCICVRSKGHAGGHIGYWPQEEDV